MKIKIGKQVETNQDIEIDLKSLVASRLLIQANAGGGKSWLLRKILEESHGEIQQLVIDLEGEFSTLREKFDYLLVGPEGELTPNIKTAKLLAKRLLELKVSTIIDISEMKKHERITFVQRFLDSLIEAPKRLWHPVLVILDEAHVFCPQSSKSESSSSVIDLMSRGRKRGFTGILATQRISKLHKDASAECNNKLIGRAFADLDRKRAGEELGFTKKEEFISLRNLKPGEFYAFGSSISNRILKMKAGDVKTTHPEAGRVGLVKPSETPENIKKLLKNVIDLPKEADEELKTVQDLKGKIQNLKIELRRASSGKVVDEKILERERNIVISKVQREYNLKYKEVELIIKGLNKQIKDLQFSLSKIQILSGEAIKNKTIAELPKMELIERKYPLIPKVQADAKWKPEVKQVNDEINQSVTNFAFGLCEKKIYSFLYKFPDQAWTKAQVAAITGYSLKSGGFNNALYKLNSNGLIERPGGKLRIRALDTAEFNKYMHTDLVGDYNFSISEIMRKLGRCPRVIFELLLENPDREFTKEEIAIETQYSENSGGFNNSIYKLSSLELIKRNNGMIRLNPDIVEILE